MWGRIVSDERARRLAFVRMGPFPIPNRLLPVHLAKAMPDWVVETFDIKPVVRRQPLTLFVNLFFMLKEHGRNLATRRITPWQAFFTTTWMFEQMSAISCRWIEQGDCLASIQIQSLFDASTAGRPHFVYTDHTHLENLRYPDFDPRKLRGPAWLELERKLYASTTRLLTRSSNVAASMIEDYGADPERTLVVGSGSNVDFGSAWVERADRPASQGVRILFVGKDWTRKGRLDLLKAFGRVHAEHPETRLVVVGPTDLPPAPGPRPPAPGLEALGQRTLEELREIYRDADVFCLPTRLEPFGVVILEAMSAGLPVIATRIGAMPDLVEEGRSGHLVPPGDPGALEQALLRLVEDAELRRRMGERGRERAVTDFSWDGVADRVARLILAELD